MSSIEPVSPPPPPVDEMWWQSPTLRSAAVLCAPAIILGLKALFKLFHWTFPVDMDSTTIASIVVAICAAAGYAAFVIAKRRVAQGKDPANPALPIRMRVL